MKRYLDPKQILQLVESGLGNRGDIGSLVEKIREQKGGVGLEFGIETNAVRAEFYTNPTEGDTRVRFFVVHDELIDNLFDALIWCAKANNNE